MRDHRGGQGDGLEVADLRIMDEDDVTLSEVHLGENTPESKETGRIGRVSDLELLLLQRCSGGANFANDAKDIH